MHEEGRETIELLERSRSGERAALEELLQRHHSWLWSYVRRRMGGELRRYEASEDVVQDVFRKLIERGPDFVPHDEHEFRKLVATIVINRLRDRHAWAHAARRDAGREQGRLDSPDQGLDPAGASVDQPSRIAMRNEEQTRLELAMQLLDPDDAALVRWRSFDNEAFARIAERLEIRENTARMRYNRALLKVGEWMEQLEAGQIEAPPHWDEPRS